MSSPGPPDHRPRLLVVAHDASRTGSPTVLDAVLGDLRRNGRAEVDLVLLRDGPLRARLARWGPTTVLGPPDGRSLRDRVAEGLVALGIPRLGRAVRRDGLRAALVGRARPDVVYLNSLPSTVVLDVLPWADVPVVLHVHELDAAVARLGEAERRALLHRVTAFVAASGAVRDLLVDRLGVDPARVWRHDEAIDPAALVPPSAGEDPAAALAVPPTAPVVVAVGTAGVRKGPDLFVQLAVASSHRPPPCPEAHFVWVGPADPQSEAWPPEADARAAGVADRVHVVGAVDDAGPWLRRADVLVLTSREDALPLVCLEASWWGTPFVTFDAGGAAALAGADEAGRAVPRLDVEAMADAVADLLAHPGEAAALAAEARRRVEAHHVVDVVAPRLWDDVLALLAAPAR